MKPKDDAPEARMSRLLALILRHQPDQFGLKLDDHGYASLEDVAHALAEKHPFATPEFLTQFAAGAGARRFVVRDGRIAARYGHSIEVEPEGSPVVPPEHLFHGTHPRNRRAVLTDGIITMGRQYCHLSATEAEAEEIGRRRADDPLVVRVDAKRMQEDGFLFFQAGHLFLTRKVPGEYVRAPRGP